MRVLVLTQKLPRPAHDGYNLRTAAYLPRLAQRHPVALLSLERGEIDAPLARQLERVVRVPERTPPRRGALGRIAHALAPSELHDRDPAVDRALAALAAEFRPDVIWSVGWRMLPHALDVDRVPVLADVVDEGAREAWLDLLRHPRPRGLAQLVRVLRFERTHFPRAERVLFVSDQDAHITGRVVPRARCEVVPNGVDVQHFAPDDTPEVEGRMVFEGAMSHVPNAEAVRYFARSVLPLVRAARPDAHLLVVGRDPGPDLLALAGPDPSASGISFTGFVDDVRPEVRRGALFVSPMVGGAGLKNKVLQAFALGKAVVATPLSIGGLGATDGAEIRVAEGDGPLAKLCLELLADRPQRQRLGQAARRLVCERFSWDQRARELEAQLCDVAARRGEAASGRE